VQLEHSSSLLKDAPMALAFALDWVPNTPVFGQFYPDFWLLSAQHRLFDRQMS